MRNKHARAIVAGVLFTAGSLLLTACGSTPPVAHANPAASATNDAGATIGGTVDPCSLLTQAEVVTAVEQPLGPGKKTTVPGDCLWTTSDFSAGVDVAVGDWNGWKTAATSGSHQPTSIGGVGDEALNLNGSNGSDLYVRKGDVGFLLTINGRHIDSLPDHGLEQEKVLAAAVLGRL